ncbi:MAG: DegV family protein [Bacilli bacterium]|nr:DegV family protein [Bacilli bacterium]
MKIAISTESICDLGEELLKEFKIHAIPFNVVLGETEGKDGDITARQLIEYAMQTKKPVRTAAVNSLEYKEHFEKLLKDYDEVIHICPCLEISSTYQNACNAANELDGKVHVIDSRALATGMGAQLIYASRLADAGRSATEIVKEIEERKWHTNTSLALENIDFLYRGGRCSIIALLGANLLKLHPQVLLKTDTGKLVSGKKFRGPLKKWMNDYIDETLRLFHNPDKEMCFLTHTIYDEENQYILEEAKKKLLDYGFKNVYITYAGATIGCHTGKNCLALIYMNDGDHPVA